MKWNWAELFGKNFFIELKNDERKYFGINEIDFAWDTTIVCSNTNLWYKRTTFFWKENAIVKVIVEENRLIFDGEINYRSYREFDTEIKTENREMILPMTSRGKKKKVTATNVLAIIPLGCSFYFCLDASYNETKSYIVVNNPRNNQNLAIGEHSKINKIRNNDDFRKFVEEYIATCPEDYFDRVNRMRNEKHKTVKYRPGDIFRIEIDRFNYCYGLITGEIKKIQKWDELPKRHSMRNLMMVPIMVRYFELITPRGDLTASELTGIPLSRVEICGDNDIIWATQPIVGHKELEPDDLEFNLICAKFITQNEHCTVFTQDFFMEQNIVSIPEEYNIHVEWGTAVTTVSSSQISEKLRQYLLHYHSPHGGVSVSIEPSLLTIASNEKVSRPAYKFNLLEETNRDIRNELFSCLGLQSNATFDDFARKFGGLTKEEILNKIR